MRVTRIQTADGSWTLRDVDRDLTFRSVHGAATESDHVFVAPSGLASVSDDRVWRVLELGFGAAMNFHRTRLRAAELGVALDYTALERQPVDADLIAHDAVTDKMVREALAGGTAVAGDVSLTVHIADWRDDIDLNGGFDALYHDPFGPEDEPDAWTPACFEWWRGLVRPTGRLMTYAVAGHVRRALAATNWLVEKRPGPPGKREVLVAVPASDARERE